MDRGRWLRIASSSSIGFSLEIQNSQDRQFIKEARERVTGARRAGRMTELESAPRATDVC